jgi:DNA polymerase|tara:strand:- start:14852 stop:16684 length:1833 start_codon:yes stop_codon:yes gene_type:complete
MDLVTLDFETYYDRDYSLSKMTTEAYVRDPRFEVIGVGVKVNDHATDWYSGADTGRFLHSMDYSDKAILCHNTAFDGAILGWRFGIKPKLWLDTLSMARPKHQMTVGGSLKNLAAHYRLGKKGDEVFNNLGRRRKDFTEDEMQRYSDYCVQDVELTYKLFKKLSKGFPKAELLVIDQTLRMYTEPTIELDHNVLVEHLQYIQERKAALLDKLGGEAKAKDILMSNPKFADLLRALGVEPPMKTSIRTGKEAYAFAKTDQGFKELLNHSKPSVRAVVEARLGVKSTIEESRTISFMGIADRGPLPIMLNYYGAHTGRFSGGDKVNLQNLPRNGKLRAALTAPKGQLIVACDSSQIEARMVAYLAEQNDLLQSFRDANDVYSEFATDVYGKPVSKANKLERHVGKTAILGLGYGMGAPKFQASLKSGFPSVTVDEGEAKRVVDLYRNKNHNIVSLWNRCNHVIKGIAAGGSGQVCSILDYDADGIRMPNGLYIRYPALRRGEDGFEYINTARAYKNMHMDNVSWTKIYGGKVVENITQAVARIVVAEQMVAIGQRYHVALQVHDEVVCVVDEDKAEEARDFMVDVMSTPPTWASDLPVACEADIGANYGEAK